MKRILVVVMFICCFLLLACSSSFADKETGEWEEIAWKYEDEVLTISGNGVIEEGYQDGNWDQRTYAWRSYYVL